MKLNHANLCTSNVTELTHIFTRHFDFVLEKEANTESAMLKGTDGFSLVLTITDQNAPQAYPHSILHNFRISFHVGFMLEEAKDVHAKHKELIDNGYSPGEIKTFEAIGANWTAFYLPAGDGIDIEVNSRS